MKLKKSEKLALQPRNLMDNRKLFCLFVPAILFLMPTFSAFAQTAPHKHALLIGVSEYRRTKDEDAEWWNLNSAPDVSALKQVLIRKFDFKPADMTILTTREQTTRASILNAFRDLAARIQPGDIVYLHYSGHGNQVLDDNGDELDGLDESIVPSDYVSRSDGSKNIRDDDIGKFLDQIKAKNPSSVTFTFDSCFSGTITRGGRQLTRGDNYHGKPPTPNPQAKEKDDTGLFSNNSVPGSFVVISATRSDQVAKETDSDVKDAKTGENGKMGALTYALVKALSEADARTTYRDLFDRVRNTVTTRVEAQNPQIEGGVDTALLKGTAIASQPYISVVLDANQNLLLQAGSLQGMTKGSRFALLPNGAKAVDDGQKLTEAEIIELDATIALLKLSGDAKVKPEVLQTARAFEIEHQYGDGVLKIALAPNSPRLGEISGELAKFPLAEITQREDWDVKLGPAAETRGAQALTLERSDGSKLAEIADDANAARNVRLALEREARFRTVRDLENSSPDLKIELRVVPVEVETNLRGQVVKIVRDKPTLANTAGKLRFDENEWVILEVRNTGNTDAFVTILDLTDDGAIAPMFPHPAIAMPDNKIGRGGEWKRIPLPFIFQLTPFKTEIFKAIATPEPTDFSPLLTRTMTRGDTPQARGALQSPLGKILRASTLTQRSNLGGAPPPNWATASVTFEVVKK